MKDHKLIDRLVRRKQCEVSQLMFRVYKYSVVL